MATVHLAEGLSLHCAVDDYLWPWEAPTPVLMMHGFARNATFWNRWVPPIADSRRIYRPDLLGEPDDHLGRRLVQDAAGGRRGV